MLGVRVSAINMEMAVERICQWIEAGEREYVCVTGVHGVIESQRDSHLMDIHNGSGMTTPDGMPMVWSGRRAGAMWMERVYGPDLMLAVLEESQRRGWSSFFYGGAEGVPEQLAERLVGRFPGLKVAGTYSPPFRPLTDEEKRAVVEQINGSGATLVWVGLSTPKQEKWMGEFRPLLSAPVILGVGAAFDFHVGRVSQAPRWVQQSGFEWLYRLLREPRRLWRRYVDIIPRFVAAIIRRPPRLVEDRSGTG